MKKLISMSLMFLMILTFSFNCSESEISPSENIVPPVTDEAFVFDPAVGEKWMPGGQYKIKWSYPGSVEEVNIILLKKKQYNKLEIQMNAVNSGIFTWNIPENITQSVSYQIKIENSADPRYFFYSNVFEISSN
ncbi:MAG: hypothetical protein IPM56_15555 [Ignavibacteriales bacterium]|nr:MAG: hypothetical protein IPM56_15555 [Ignavibacteriales bacterium]